MTKINWVTWLKLGVQHAGLKPSEFWTLTPYELLLVLGMEGAEKPFNRARLFELEKEFSEKTGA